jgi:hypothetical protein
MQLTEFIETRAQAGMSTIAHVHMTLTCSWGDRHA